MTKTALIIFLLITLVALFYGEENWRGKHAWEKHRQLREAKGDSFDWAVVAPAPIPDDQNFAATPLFAELFPKPPVHPRLESLRLPGSNAAGDWHAMRLEDLAAWQQIFTNTDLLAALSKYDPVLREIEATSRRPGCRFPIRYEDYGAARLPHLSYYRQLTKVYRLRALVELAANQPEAAFAEIHTSLRVAKTLHDEPILISFLVRGAVLDLILQPVWEGLAAHRWNDRQLAALHLAFEQIDRFQEFANCMKGERLVAYGDMQQVIDHPSERAKMIFFETDTSFTSPERRWQGYLIPAGWLYQNELTIDSFYTDDFLPAVDMEHRQVSPQRLEAVQTALNLSRVTPYNIIAVKLVPAANVMARIVAQSQTAMDEAAAACALERHWLAHGEYPEHLAALVPDFLKKIPADVIDGQPLRYRRTEDGRFVLYSIGWNAKDDGGVVAMSQEKSARWDPKQGDWVWQYPRPEAPKINSNSNR